MTVLADLTAITMTANAKGVVSAKGADLTVLVNTAKTHVTELQALLKQIISHHPTGGGDAAQLRCPHCCAGATGLVQVGARGRDAPQRSTRRPGRMVGAA